MQKQSPAGVDEPPVHSLHKGTTCSV